jgi:hypothetical protein
MSELVKSIGNGEGYDYEIRMEKLDHCPPFEGAKIVENWSLVTSLLSGLILISAIIVLFTVPPDDVEAMETVQNILRSLIVVVILDLIIFAAIAGNIDRCGARLFLKRKGERDSWFVKCKYIQFRDNPERDAERVNIVITKFQKIAERLMSEHLQARAAEKLQRDREKEETNECCIRYREVFKKVAPEESE